MDIVSYNREAWNKQSKKGSRWSEPIDSETVQLARSGTWNVILTPSKPVPREWFGDIRGKELLCLAAGGGQQAPTFAAAGANVTSFDNSDEQLAKDKFVSDRDDLGIKIVQGDMADLSHFTDESFDIIFHPVSNVFVPDVNPVWKECHRVLRTDGRLTSGFMNPVHFLIDHDEMEESEELRIKYKLPFSDVKDLPSEKLDQIEEKGYAYEFGHTLNDQIGGQIKSGFSIQGFYEDKWEDEDRPLDAYTSTFIATLSIKNTLK